MLARAGATRTTMTDRQREHRVRARVGVVTQQPLNVGDLIDAVVTQKAPFGVFVRSDTGIEGLVPRAEAAEGATLHLRVVSFDAELQRFSGELAD